MGELVPVLIGKKLVFHSQVVMESRHRLAFFLSLLFDLVELVLTLAAHPVYLLVRLQPDLGELTSVVLQLLFVAGEDGVERGCELAELVGVDGYFKE